MLHRSSVASLPPLAQLRPYRATACAASLHRVGLRLAIPHRCRVQQICTKDSGLKLTVNDAPAAAEFLGQALRALDILAERDGDGGLGLLAGGPTDEQRGVVAKLAAVQDFCRAELAAMEAGDPEAGISAGLKGKKHELIKATAILVPLQIQATLGLAKAQLMLPGARDPDAALTNAENGFAALEAMGLGRQVGINDDRHGSMHGETAQKNDNLRRKRTKPKAESGGAGAQLYLSAALQLSATRMEIASLDPQQWPEIGKSTVQFLLQLLPRFQDECEPTGDAPELHAALMAIRQCYAEVGRAHLHGWGVPVSEEKAVRFWRLAAEQGDPDAAYALSTFFGHPSGRGGLAHEPATALHWSKVAAEQGHVPAMCACAEHFEGAGGENVEHAIRWWRLAALAGDVVAGYRCARLLENIAASTDSENGAAEETLEEAEKLYRKIAIAEISPQDVSARKAQMAARERIRALRNGTDI
eukprot:SAG31_NODE_2057_length_6542_cov_2.889182_6_plen_473_part_00